MLTRIACMDCNIGHESTLCNGGAEPGSGMTTAAAVSPECCSVFAVMESYMEHQSIHHNEVAEPGSGMTTTAAVSPECCGVRTVVKHYIETSIYTMQGCCRARVWQDYSNGIEGAVHHWHAEATQRKHTRLR